MKYLLVVFFLASIAGLEVFHVLSGDDVQNAAVCTAPEGKADAIRDMVLGHLKNH